MSTAQQSAERLQISLADIALLARVRRPVVSVWRSRAARTANPFPNPVATVRGQEFFDADEVTRWLAATGRGNNQAVNEDVAAFATVTGASPRDDRVVFDALTAALCLKVITGCQLGALGTAELLDLADEHDPDDEFLYSELAGVGVRLGAVARYADLTADAAISPQAAFERLMADRFRSDLGEYAAVVVSESALSLAATIAVSLTDSAGVSPVYVDPTPGSADLLLAVLREHGERGPIEVVTPTGEGPAARLARRRLRVHDVYREELPLDADGGFAVGRPVTYIAQFPTPAAPMMTDAEILAAIENIIVQMDDSQRGVVLAAASALCDGFADRQAVAIRANLLRAGHVRAIVRLPKGLVPARSRQALALWILGPSHREDDAAERRTVVADLRDAALTDDVVDSLVTDLTAATGTPAMVRAHAFRFARPVPTRVLLTTRRSLVETAPLRQVAAADAAELLVRIDQARARAAARDRSPTLPAVVADPGRAPMPANTIGALIDARRLRLLPGNRLDAADLDSREGTRVIGVPELTGEVSLEARRIDRLRLASRYDAARLTEPGDVIFCVSPRPAALVDRNGASVVAFPARVLRIDPADPAGLLPDLLAADINAAPATARQWRLWPVRAVSDDHRVALSDALAELRRAREQAEERIAQIDEFTDLITRAATGGGLALLPAQTKGTRGCRRERRPPRTARLRRR